MPSPDYPSPIKTVSNINLLNLGEKAQYSDKGFVISWKDSVIKMSGTATENLTIPSNVSGITNAINLGYFNAGTYTLFRKILSGNIINPVGTGIYLRSSKGEIAKKYISSETGISFTLNEKTQIYMYIFVDSGTQYSNLEIGVKIFEGAGDLIYSPYNQGCIKIIKSNKNLYDKNTMIELDGSYRGYDNGRVLSNSTVYGLKIPVFPEKTYISTSDVGYGNWSNLCFFDSNMNYISGIPYNLLDKVFTTPKNCYFITLALNKTYKWFQLENGSVGTDYVDYKGESYILPIQQEMLQGDLFTQELNKKEIHHWNKIILDGTENWLLGVSGDAFTRFYFNTSYPATSSSSDVLCTHFAYGNVSFLNKNCINQYNKNEYYGINLCTDNNISKNVTELKTYLKSQYDAGTPVMVYYKLATPTSINCTEEQNTVLNKLSSSELYSPQTNIYTDDIALLNAKYLGLPNPYNSSKIYSLGDIKNLINIPAFNIKYEQQYFQSTNTNFVLNPNFIYTLSFDYNINETSTDLYYSLGYGTNEYDTDLKLNVQYQSLTKGRNSVSFIVPENIPDNTTLWVKFAQTIILADINVDISNVQLESGNVSTGYEDPSLYNIYPTSASKNLFDYNSPVYLLKSNATYTPIQNGYNIKPVEENQDAYIGIGIKSVLNPGDTYTISFSQLGQFEKFSLYTTEKGNENIISEISIKNNTFVAPDGVYDLQLVFEVDSSSLSNYIEIWNIQIEADNVISEYEPYVSNSAVISLDEPLRGLGEYRDLVCLESPNLLNPDTQSGIVKGNTTYYLNQAGNTQYYIWYYNEDGNLITFIDKEGHEASGITGTKGSFTTHKDCVKITITKSSNPDSKDTTGDELKTNQVGITKGDNAQVYYPYVTEPSVIRYIQHRVFDGVNNKFTGKHSTIYTDTNGFYGLTLSGKILGSNGDIKYGICNYLKYIKNVSAAQAVKSTGLWWEGSSSYNYASLPITSLNDANQWLVNLNNAKNPMVIDYVLKTPVVTPLSNDNINALKTLSSYKPISNVFTNNEVLGYLKLDYVSDYTEQQTQNAYVLLKCWNANSMPYICHSNYIDIPEDKDKVFIWMRRKNNLFDLKIENLGDYNEDDKPTDKTKPIVTLEINPNTVEDTRIPVTAYSIDDNGLKTVRFSKDNGNTWDEIVSVDGLSSTNSYIFINLTPNTTYTIRVEAIDLAGNIGGISQQITTKSS